MCMIGVWYAYVWDILRALIMYEHSLQLPFLSFYREAGSSGTRSLIYQPPFPYWSFISPLHFVPPLADSFTPTCSDADRNRDVLILDAVDSNLPKVVPSPAPEAASAHQNARVAISRGDGNDCQACRSISLGWNFLILQVFKFDRLIATIRSRPFDCTH